MEQGIIKLNTSIIESASVVGGREHEGPLGSFFDVHDPQDSFGMDTWEKAESEMQRMALNGALAKGELREQNLDAIFAGDLLNQCTSSAYGLLDFDVPYFGLYGACSTAAEGLLLAGTMVTNGVFDLCATVASSHNCTAERQYRTPLEYGGQRTPTAQWTVTGAGAFLVGKPNDQMVRLTAALPGIAVEKGITDTNNMGAAMAPAAADTLLRFLRESQTAPDEYDVIVTGDLGYEGGDILCELMKIEGYDISGRYQDCGQIIFTRQTQDTHAGGSGCGCSAVVMASYFLPKLLKGEIRKMIFMGTGAMMSPSSIQQGLAIPGIAHLLVLEAPSANQEEEK